MKVAKKDGSKEDLDEGKLWDSIYYPLRESGFDHGEAVDYADEVKQEVVSWIYEHEDNVVTHKEIREKVEEVLKQRDDQVALMYDKHLDIN
jgi:transcriptional regulator NrdR family protein